MPRYHCICIFIIKHLLLELKHISTCHLILLFVLVKILQSKQLKKNYMHSTVSHETLNGLTIHSTKGKLDRDWTGIEDKGILLLYLSIVFVYLYFTCLVLFRDTFTFTPLHSTTDICTFNLLKKGKLKYFYTCTQVEM